MTSTTASCLKNTCLWICRKRWKNLRLNSCPLLHIVLFTILQPLHTLLFQLNGNHVHQNTEYSHCHQRSSFPSSRPNFLLWRTEFKLTSWRVLYPVCYAPQMSFVCFPSLWPPGLQSSCTSCSESICSTGGWTADQGLGMICNLS